jgi:hypothetical protein
MLGVGEMSGKKGRARGKRSSLFGPIDRYRLPLHQATALLDHSADLHRAYWTWGRLENARGRPMEGTSLDRNHGNLPPIFGFWWMDRLERHNKLEIGGTLSIGISLEGVALNPGLGASVSAVRCQFCFRYTCKLPGSKRKKREKEKKERKEERKKEREKAVRLVRQRAQELFFFRRG